MPNSWLCVDANLVLRLVADPRDEAVRRLWETWGDEDRQLAVPNSLYYDVTNALYRYQKHKWLSEVAVRLALKAMFSLPLHLHGGVELHEHALEFAHRLALPTAYDAHYLALAEQLGAEFWTADWRLVQAYEDTLPWLRLVEA
jgi:predicted nucleic acid-binding protein